MCTKELRDKFTQLFDQFKSIKALNNEQSLGIRETIVKILLAIVTKLLVKIISKYWEE